MNVDRKIKFTKKHREQDRENTETGEKKYLKSKRKKKLLEAHTRKTTE